MQLTKPDIESLFWIETTRDGNDRSVVHTDRETRVVIAAEIRGTASERFGGPSGPSTHDLSWHPTEVAYLNDIKMFGRAAPGDIRRDRDWARWTSHRDPRVNGLRMWVALARCAGARYRIDTTECDHWLLAAEMAAPAAVVARIGTEAELIERQQYATRWFLSLVHQTHYARPLARVIPFASKR